MQESNPMEHFNLKGSADAIQIWIMAKWEQVGKEVFNFCRTRSVVLSRFGNDGGVGMFWRRWAWNSTSTWIDVSPHAGKPGVPVQHFSHRVSCKFQQGLLQSCRGDLLKEGILEISHLLKEAIPRQKELQSWGEPGQAHGLIFLDSPAQQIGSQDTGDARFGDPFCWRWPQSIHPLFDWERGITNNKSSLQVNDWLVVWNTNFMTFHSVGNFTIPTDELHHFSEG